MKRLLALLIACLALTIAACGGDDDDDAGNGDAATPTTEQTDTGAAPDGGEAVSISIIDNDYDPAETTVPAGTTVTWTNDGQAPHTVTAEGSFDSGDIEPGGTFEETLDEPGTIDYVCTIHPGQAGTVIVE